MFRDKRWGVTRFFKLCTQIDARIDLCATKAGIDLQTFGALPHPNLQSQSPWVRMQMCESVHHHNRTTIHPVLPTNTTHGIWIRNEEGRQLRLHVVHFYLWIQNTIMLCILLISSKNRFIIILLTIKYLKAKRSKIV